MLRRWIEEGAPWGKHWAFEKPVKAELPADCHASDRCLRPRDGSRRKASRLSPAAPRHTLARRLSFDLTGLPPSPEEVAAFVNDRSPDAYGKLVDVCSTRRTSASAWRCGGSMPRAIRTPTASRPMPRARNWPWRDWVVDVVQREHAVRSVHDRAVRRRPAAERHAGAEARDLLSPQSHDQRRRRARPGGIAHRLRHRPREHHRHASGSGSRSGCTQCHSHKFDPISQADYYALIGVLQQHRRRRQGGNAREALPGYQSPLAQRAVAEAQQLVDERKPRRSRRPARTRRRHFSDWLASAIGEVAAAASPRGIRADGAELESQRRHAAHAGSRMARCRRAVRIPKQDDYRLIAPVAAAAHHGLEARSAAARIAHRRRALARQVGRVHPHRHQGAGAARGAARRSATSTVAGAVADAPRSKKATRDYGDVKGTLDDDPRNGWTTKGATRSSRTPRVFAFAEPLVLDADEELIFELRQRSTLGDANIGRFRVVGHRPAGRRRAQRRSRAARATGARRSSPTCAARREAARAAVRAVPRGSCALPGRARPSLDRANAPA